MQQDSAIFADGVSESPDELGVLAALEPARMEQQEASEPDPANAPDFVQDTPLVFACAEHCRATMSDQSSFVRPRSFFEEARCDFAVSRRTLEPRVGRLARRIFGTTCARVINSSSRARASARLASCVRCWRAVMINTPSCVTRLPANARRRCRTSSVSERRLADIKAQLDGGGNFIDVLAARTRGANKGICKFGI